MLFAGRVAISRRSLLPKESEHSSRRVVPVGEPGRFNLMVNSCKIQLNLINKPMQFLNNNAQEAKRNLVHLATSPPGSPVLSYSQQASLIGMVAQRTNAPPSPSRLSPHISYSVYSPQNTHTGTAGGTAEEVDVMSMLDLPSLDLGESAGANATGVSSSSSSGEHRTSLDLTDDEGNTACTIPFLVVSSHGRTVQLEATHGETILDCKNKLHQKKGIQHHGRYSGGLNWKTTIFSHSSGGGLMEGYGFGNGTTVQFAMQLSGGGGEQ